MNSRGEYTAQIADLEGVYYRDANDLLTERLKESGSLFTKASITHRVAFCPRTHIPLVYKAQDSRFIDIQSIKDKLLEANESINWYPEHFKYGRFAKSIESAPDWCISRSRYWGTPMPVYAPEQQVREQNVQSDDVVVIGSREELYQLQLNGSNVLEKKVVDGKEIYWNTVRDAELDMHIPYLDDVWFEIDGVKYVRIPDVLDSRMESGSMPYGQMHYPFENKEKMEASFPADYIVEYTGQIRAWFYVMHVLGVILFDKPAFTNVICHGVVSGNDGRKMSKSLKNYPDPKPTFEQYGGDAIRMSILTSPLFNAGDTSISEENIADALRGYILPLWNAFSFFVTYANIDGWEVAGHKEQATSDNVLDQWILGELSDLRNIVTDNLDHYNLQQSSRALGEFLDNLTNWYIRRSRRRFWKSESDTDKDQAYQTLYDVLLGFCQVAAPFMPFVTEYIYRELKGVNSVSSVNSNSVHLLYWPEVGERDEQLAQDMHLAQQIVTMGLAWRSQHDLRVRQPLSTLTVGMDLSEYYQAIIREELNIKQVVCDPSLNDEVTKIVKPDGKKIGPKFGGDVKIIFAEAKSGNFVEQSDGSVLVADRFVLETGEYEISYIKNDPAKDVVVDQGIVMSIDATITPELELEGYVRDLVRAIQDARKEADYDIADRIEIVFHGHLADEMKAQFVDYIQQETLSTVVDKLVDVDIEKEVILGEHVVLFGLKR
ncbi:MAG: class I tRNA ligase family protein [Candidatus Peribacteria bacterium]|nr:MAG: class I tRNA ligase family protein [Candidatus Peribacteria bacterium]